MNQIIISFLILILLMAIFIGVGIYFHQHVSDDINKQYIDENGDHTYYDRALIEKKKYFKSHPGDKSIRTLKKLFRGN